MSPARRLRLRTAAALVVALAAGAAAWWYLAPPALGGSTSFVIVDGTSMLPGLRRDDLVLVRRAESYRVGDIVAYRSRLLHRVVLHRIVAIHHGVYTFKGDNNGYLDPEKPRRSALVGSLRVRLPHAGSLAALVRTPLVAGAIVALLVLVLGLAGASPRAAGDSREP